MWHYVTQNFDVTFYDIFQILYKLIWPFVIYHILSNASFLWLSLTLVQYLRGTPPLKTYLQNQFTLKLSTYFKSWAPSWDLFFSKRIFKIARFSAFTGQKVLTPALFCVTHYAKTFEPMDLKFLHKLWINKTEGF